MDYDPATTTRLDLYSDTVIPPIPTEVGLLTSLTHLRLSADSSLDEVDGPFPEIGLLTQLTWLELYACAITGPIPTHIGKLAKLRWLNLEWNKITGPIPPEIGQLTKLEAIMVAEN